MIMWWITCPNPTCGFQGTLEDYKASDADECSCPNCNLFFQFEEPEDEDEFLEEETSCPA